MIALMKNFPDTGIVWYKGECNLKNAGDYGMLFGAMIRDWKQKWGRTLHFDFVQLPNFDTTVNSPPGRNLPILREFQKEVLGRPATGMAVTVDIGNWRDIHSNNNWDVAYITALLASEHAYGGKIRCSGPEHSHIKVDVNRIIFAFSQARNSLSYTCDLDDGFELSGRNSTFSSARFTFAGNTIALHSDSVLIRHNWSSGPAGHTFNTAEFLLNRLLN